MHFHTFFYANCSMADSSSVLPVPFSTENGISKAVSGSASFRIRVQVRLYLAFLQLIQLIGHHDRRAASALKVAHGLVIRCWLVAGIHNENA